MVPFELPEITYLQAVGFGLVLSAFLGTRGLGQYNKSHDIEEDEVAVFLAQSGYALVLPLVTLCLGYGVTLFQ